MKRYDGEYTQDHAVTAADRAWERRIKRIVERWDRVPLYSWMPVLWRAENSPCLSIRQKLPEDVSAGVNGSLYVLRRVMRMTVKLFRHAF